MKIKTFIKLGDICDISAGQGAPQGDSNYCDNGTPFVKAGNLIELLQGKNETDIQKVSEDVAKKHKLKKYTAGSILFAKSGMSCMKGYVYQLKNDSYVVSHLAIVKPIKDSSDYIEYCLRHIKPNSLVKDEAYPSISLQDISNLKIPLPSLEEQIKISKQLYICTQIINKHKKQLEKYDTLIKSRFIEMFGDLANNTKNWIIKNFTECAIIDTKMIKDFEKYADYPHIGIDSIEKETGVLSGYRTVKEDNVISGKYLFTSEHIIYSKIRPNLNKVAMPNFEGLCSADAYPILVKKNIATREYLTFVMRSDFFVSYILSFSRRANMPKVNKEQVESFNLPLPPFELQQQFSSFVQQVDKSKFSVQKSLEKAETLYKSLMQEYFA